MLKVAVPLTAVALASSGCVSGGGTGSSSASNGAALLKLLDERMSEPGWKQQLEPFKDTSPIPQTGGLEYMPEQALGHVWAVAIKKNVDASKTCQDTPVGPSASADTEIMSLGRFFAADNRNCKVKSVGEQIVYEFRTDSGAAAGTAIGPFLSASKQEDRAFEVLITHPTHVTVENQADCIPVEQLRELKFSPSDRICAVYWVHTVKQTKIHSRAYAKVKGELQGGLSIIKVGGAIYSSSEERKTATVITGSHSVITQYLDRDPATGYVVKAGTKMLAVGTKPVPVDVAVKDFLATKTDKAFKVELTKEIPAQLVAPQ